MYKCYQQPLTRVAFVKEVDSKEAAIQFLKEYPNIGIVKYNGNNITLEELENAESFGSESRTELDNDVSSGGSVSEDTDSELFDFAWGDTESSSERDN